ncbi:MAG: family 16 glycoside hydrolase [Phycisphaerales bacterium]
MRVRAMGIVETCIVLSLAVASHAEIKVVADQHPGDSASAGFRFPNVPLPSQNDAATRAAFTLVDGRRDRNGGELDTLHDGRVPTEEDQPAANFFFNAGTDGGRILVDLGGVIEVKQVNTYSWHPGARGPQVYGLYASEGSAGGFVAQPKKGTDPATCGWTLIAQVDTRPQQGDGGGQYGVGISDSGGVMGKYRYLLFDVSRTEGDDPFGNTFFSEIDVVDPVTPVVPVGAVGTPSDGVDRREVVEAESGKYRIAIDTTETPDLTEWAHKELAPVVREWYPKLVEMLPSEGYDAPTQVSITFSESMQGVAATGGTRIRCAAAWFRQNLQGEAKGAVVHELAHVVQNYGLARRNNPNATRTPGWLVEGICDYIRWFLYEPQTRGAEITSRNIDRARYDGNYRISANFLNWVTGTYDKDIVAKLNAAAREGRYSEDLWKTATGKTVQELGDEWKAAMGKKIAEAAAEAAKMNILTEEEKAAGWKLLFNGTDLTGWHNFRREDVRPGWQIKDGVLVCADPQNAGDLCTNDPYDWFELQIEYNISPAGNSGIMYHVTDEGRSAWATGPEFQLEDNAAAADPVRCGWLYALYQPPADPSTGKTLDATKPAGQWNHIRLLISPTKCAHVVNGVTYFEYVLGSEDFQQRVAASKFSRMPLFAKSDRGYIALQGDHGQVSFRNIKIRPIQAVARDP